MLASKVPLKPFLEKAENLSFLTAYNNNPDALIENTLPTVCEPILTTQKTKIFFLGKLMCMMVQCILWTPCTGNCTFISQNNFNM